MRKPLIGITPSPGLDQASHGTFYRYSLSRTYTDALRQAGGTPVILPVGAQNVDEILSELDGLLLSGGGDIDPAAFGDSTVHERTYGVDLDRDRFELDAFRWAVANDLPTFCICRGIQSMNVAMGGTLHQHIPDDVPDAIEHRQSTLGKTIGETSHQVTFVAGQHPIRASLGGDTMEVNSFHHQSVGRPADELEVIATSADGVIEALWHPDMTYGLGVQWHPEMLAPTFPQHAQLFDAFVTAIRSRRMTSVV